MPDGSSPTTTGHDPGNERMPSHSRMTQHRTPPQNDHSSRANTALVSKAEKKNVHCPLCGGMVRYRENRSGSGNLLPECENPNCTWTTDFLRKDKQPLTEEIRMKHWAKFGRRY